MMHKSLCIILLNYKNEADTVSCVKSVLDSDCSELPYIVVVDNSSSETHLDEKLRFYPDIQVLFPNRNLGFAEGNNFGIRWVRKHVNFNFLLILNNDTLLWRNAISIMISYAVRHPETDFFAPCIITSDSPPRIWYAGGEINNCLMTPRINFIGKDYNYVQLRDCNTEFVSGCAVLISANGNDLDENLFDPYFFMYDEDVDLSLNIIERGGHISFIRDAVIVHKCQGSQLSESKKKINQLSPDNSNLVFYLRHTINNRFYIIDKHYTGINRLEIKLCIISYWLLKSVQFGIHLRFKAAFTVIFEIISYSFCKRNNHICSDNLLPMG